MPEENALPDRSEASRQKLKTQIVIVGGGAGGLELARRLGARFGRKRHDIILIDKGRTHVWKPLLHEVAAGTLDAALDEVGYRSHCRRWGYRYVFGTLEAVDRAARQVAIAPVLEADGTELIGRLSIRYDYLVLAFGGSGNDFGTPGVREHCLFLDDREQADRFRLRLLDQCVRVSRMMIADPDAGAYVRVAIVGGGATGVELAAELYNAASGLAYYGLEVFDESRLRVTLVEAGPRILPQLPERLAEAAKEELEALGVLVLTGAQVTAARAKAIETSAGPIEADLMVWAAGVKGQPMAASPEPLETSRDGRLVVLPTLQTSRDERILAIGDCSYCVQPGYERGVPPRAQAAHQMASAAYRNLVRLMDGRPLRPFVYRDHGSLVSLSRYSAIGSLMGSLVRGRLAIEGRLARFVYASLYRQHLIAIHGWIGGLARIVIGRVDQVIRPRLKLH